MNNENNMTASMYTGSLDFENYWGKKLVSVEIIHYLSSIFDSGKFYSVYKKINNIEDKTVVPNAMGFRYSLGDFGYLDYWMITITTEDNEIYSTNGSHRCSIEEKDNGKVILGVNGDSKRMYISMTSGNCSSSLKRI